MKIQLAHTYDDIICIKNLLLAWEEFVADKDVDSKIDIELFAYRLMDNIVSLHTDLANHAYRHGGYKSFFITDPKRRHIHKASVRDRLLHHAVYRILYPFFDRTFIADSYSCRDDKGVHRALNRFRDFAYIVSKNHTRTCWVLKCDIKKFFASIDHGILIGMLAEYIPDKDIFDLLREIIGSFCTPPLLPPPRPVSASASSRAPPIRLSLRAGSRAGGERRGLPLGNLTSQLFANIYLNSFDQWVKHTLKAEHYIRYADDFVFLSEDRAWLVDIIPQIRHFLADHLHLTLHPDKMFLRTAASGMDFLGWVHFPDHRVLRESTKRRMFRRVAEHPTEETLRSYLGLLSHGNARHVCEDAVSLYWLSQ